MSTSRVIGFSAVGGASLGVLAGWSAVFVVVPALVRRSGHYGSHR